MAGAVVGAAVPFFSAAVETLLLLFLPLFFLLSSPLFGVNRVPAVAIQVRV